MKQREVLAVGAHPDDCEFGCFGTLAFERAHGSQVSILILTRGEKGGDPTARGNEAREAAKTIDADILEFGNFPYGELSDTIETVRLIESAISRTQATVVLIPSQKDRHQDHRSAALAGISASRHVDEVYQYETPLTVQDFSPQLFVDIQPYLETKKRAIAVHRSQASRSYFAEEAIIGLPRYRAYQAWGGRKSGAAEAFEVARLVVS